MNYFELFDLEVDLEIDLKKLKQAYLKLSKLYHPDFSTLESDEKQDEHLKMSAMINEAYNVLKEEDSRIEYILKINGLLNETESRKILPQSFLFEMMELNEELQEIKSSDRALELSNFKEKLEEYSKRIKIESNSTVTDFDQTYHNNKLNKWLLYYLKKKYLQRLYESLT